MSSVGTELDDVSAVFGALLSEISAATPTATPTATSDVMSAIAGIFSANPTNITQNAIQLIQNGLVPARLEGVIDGFSDESNSDDNVNSSPAGGPLYPQASDEDPSYEISESRLRGAINIPPVILVPGTGLKGGISFQSNLIKLLSNSTYGDPVWLNIPGFLLADAQESAEFVAYAIHYVSAVSGGSNVSVIAWSQGNLDAQWAFKYWPSARKLVANFISISADFHGTILANVLCPSFPKLPCPPSVIQQRYTSGFIRTLRIDDGDSAYVPTTSIFSATDEIVEPQHGQSASAFIKDARNVGVSNNEVQSICAGQPAGSLYTHEGVLFSPLAYALIVDALTNPGPGDPSRLDLGTLCQQVVTPELSLEDALVTQATLVIAVLNLYTYKDKVFIEPPIKEYAAS
ncbi:hypothetical protein B0J12DRAFT_790501 [Macrophomina phaseolina]|uniref:Lipase B n=1 Tax=Macrophomina phaseolina TaxID=35725 RepID=A0ABQ8FSB7_9PEZI|nr:hypothetical protein B0J12DRAFT_790501 [Macrophomina phaseolina]